MSENIMSRKRWVPWSYKLDETTVTAELKRMDALEAADFKSNLAEAFAAVHDLFNLRLEMATNSENTSTEVQMGYVARIQKVDSAFFKALDRATVTKALTECVRDVRGFEVEGETVSGVSFLSDPELLRAVLIELRRLTELSATEGKASSSPSTSDSVASEPPSTASPAPSTEPEDSTLPSTVQETQPATA